MYDPAILSITDDVLAGAVASGISNIAALCLQVRHEGVGTRRGHPNSRGHANLRPLCDGGEGWAELSWPLCSLLAEVWH